MSSLGQALAALKKAKEEKEEKERQLEAENENKMESSSPKNPILNLLSLKSGDSKTPNVPQPIKTGKSLSLQMVNHWLTRPKKSL